MENQRKIKVVKFELYPADEPSGHAVGFSYESNGRSGYIDTLVSFAESSDKTPEQIISLALNQKRPLDDDTEISISEIINKNLSAFEAKNPLIGLEIALPTNK